MDPPLNLKKPQSRVETSFKIQHGDGDGGRRVGGGGIAFVCIPDVRRAAAHCRILRFFQYYLKNEIKADSYTKLPGDQLSKTLKIDPKPLKGVKLEFYPLVFHKKILKSTI